MAGDGRGPRIEEGLKRVSYALKADQVMLTITQRWFAVNSVQEVTVTQSL